MFMMRLKTALQLVLVMLAARVWLGMGLEAEAPMWPGKGVAADAHDETAVLLAPKEAAKEPVATCLFKPHDSYPAMETAVDVLYCPVCGLPPDFCQYGPSWEKCKPWCIENVPHYYPELSGVSLEDAKKKAEELNAKGKEKLLPGGKVKREKSPRVNIRKLSRGGRKCVTSVAGLDMFGIKLDDVAKLFKKKFACGCAVVKGENTAPDTVDIQGDFEDEVIDIIVAEWKQVPQEKISVLDAGNKKKGKGR
ncbi:TMA22 [Symbiodinium natans]|uniref:TMA22 protein n=1 Tax=Symbiodinium natans TaxID=878477 RepID=A0A812PE65_9DINO|nr:TMA22 [Symbiodinium natans]